MFNIKDLEGLIKIFNIRKKSELVKYCKDATIYFDDFVALILVSEAGLLPYRHEIHYIDTVPKHLLPNKEEMEALGKSGVGKLEGKALKFSTKVHQLFKDRRYLVGHIFYTPDLTYWHLFYFDQRDFTEGKSHWQGGSHIHLINYLWPKYSAEEIWKYFVDGNPKVRGSIHIRFVREREKRLTTG